MIFPLARENTMRIHLKNPHCSLGDFYPLSKEAVKVDFTRRSSRSGVSMSRCRGHDMMKGRDSPEDALGKLLYLLHHEKDKRCRFATWLVALYR